MKKIVILLISVFVLFTNAEMKAQCDPGFTLVTKQILYNTCWYNVDICYKCIGTNPYGVVKVMGIREVNPPCPSLESYSTILNHITTIIEEPEYIINNLCLQNVPPCDVPPYGIVEWYVRAVCWQKVRTGPDQIEYYVCPGSSYCITKWRICWLNGIEQRTLLEGPVLDSPSNCPTTPEPEDPVGIGQWSTCFTVSTPCD
jgi:hypothetical protein